MVEEAMDEEVYQAKKRRRRVIIEESDTEEEAKEEEEEVKKEDDVGEDNEEDGEEVSSSDDMGVVKSNGDAMSHQFSAKWKEGLVVKAIQSYKHRSSSSTSLRRLIYSGTPLPGGGANDEEESSKDDDRSQEFGELFQLTKKKASTIFQQEESSLVRSNQALGRDWCGEPVVLAAKSLFVTGNWGEESAQTLLDEDDDLYGDFEDLETENVSTELRAEEVGKEEGDVRAKKRLEKKRKLKEAFDAGYDEEEGEGGKDGGGAYLDDLKREVTAQEEMNREEFAEIFDLQ